MLLLSPAGGMNVFFSPPSIVSRTISLTLFPSPLPFNRQGPFSFLFFSTFTAILFVW